MHGIVGRIERRGVRGQILIDDGGNGAQNGADRIAHAARTRSTADDEHEQSRGRERAAGEERTATT